MNLEGKSVKNKFVSYAKWILTGEHAVIRGKKAIAFPLKKYQLSMETEKNLEQKILIEGSEIKGGFLHEEIISLLRSASSYTKIPFEKFSGIFNFSNTIPISAGLGSSAALCSVIAKFCASLGYSGDLVDLGRKLENRFHKNSSGLDVAASISDDPVVFQNNKIQKFLRIKNLPHFTLTNSGKKSSTSECVEKVKKIFQTDESRAIFLDNKMNFSAELCEQGLENENFSKIAEGIKLGSEIFKEWELYNKELSEVENSLYANGAAACKPIGSGLGGYMLALWDREPPKDYFDIYLTLENQ